MTTERYYACFEFIGNLIDTKIDSQWRNLDNSSSKVDVRNELIRLTHLKIDLLQLRDTCC